MTELTDAQKNDFKNQLVEMEKEAREKHAELQVTIRNYKESAADAIDQASKVGERNDLLAQSAHFEKSIRQIVKTLNNFDDYGFCMECGCEIDVRRLTIQPATTHCVHCKEVEEMKASRSRPLI